VSCLKHMDGETRSWRSIRPRRDAFTLIELLVVISIIALLIGILLPVLGAARDSAAMTREMAAQRQLQLSYNSYALDHGGAFIPGHTRYDGVLTTDVGDPLSSFAADRWPWRLVDYADQSVWGFVLVNRQAQAMADRDAPSWDYSVSVYPSFGLNLYSLGGYYTMISGQLTDQSMTGKLDRFEQARQPSRMIAFATAGVADAGDPSQTTHGFWRISPPTRPYQEGVTGWTPDAYRYPDSGPPNRWGWVHPRWNSQALFSHLDGHVEPLSQDAMRDMTRWSNTAANTGNPDWTP